MRKKIRLMIMTCVLWGAVCACSEQENSQMSSVSEAESTSEAIIETKEKTERVNPPDIAQVRSICELATLECYYHNVAKSVKTKGEGLWHIGERERVFWIEYSGVAKLGINVSKVNMEINGEQIEITIPKAELLGLSDYTFAEDSYISSDDGINKNPITAENQTEAIKAAQEDIRQLFAEDDAMLMRAQDNAKKLIENYIRQLGELTKTEYRITWKYEEDGQKE